MRPFKAKFENSEFYFDHNKAKFQDLAFVKNMNFINKNFSSEFVQLFENIYIGPKFRILIF